MTQHGLYALNTVLSAGGRTSCPSSRALWLAVEEAVFTTALCRCTAGFDHHWSVICNCVGTSNRRSYIGYLCCVLLAQVIFSHLMLVICFRSATSQMHNTGTILNNKQLLWRAGILGSQLHPGKLLLTILQASFYQRQLDILIPLIAYRNTLNVVFALLQIPFLFSNTYLLCRGALCIACNLTTHELYNLHRW